MTETHEDTTEPRVAARDAAVLTLEAVAELLGTSQAGLSKRIIRGDDFPEPLVREGRTRLWSWAQIEPLADLEQAALLLPAHVLLDPGVDHEVTYLGSVVDSKALSYDFLVDGERLISYSYPLYEVWPRYRFNEDLARVDRYADRGLDVSVTGHWVYVVGEQGCVDDPSSQWDVSAGYFPLNAQNFGRNRGPVHRAAVYEEEGVVAQAYQAYPGALLDLERVLGVTLPMWPRGWQDVAVMAEWTPGCEPRQIQILTLDDRLVLEAVAAGRADERFARDIESGAVSTRYCLESYLRLVDQTGPDGCRRCPLDDPTAQARLDGQAPGQVSPASLVDADNPANVWVLDERVARSKGKSMILPFLERVGAREASRLEFSLLNLRAVSAPYLGQSLLGHQLAGYLGLNAGSMQWWLATDSRRIWFGSAGAEHAQWTASLAEWGISRPEIDLRRAVHGRPPQESVAEQEA